MLETRLLLFVVVPFVVHVSKSFQKRVITLSPCMFPEFRDMYCFKDLRHKSYHTSPLPNCFSSCLSNKYSQLLTHQTNTRTEKSPTRIADSGVHHCSILVAAMGRICDLSFAVILVFCLTKGTSSNQGKPYHWHLYKTQRRNIISGSDSRNYIFDLDRGPPVLSSRLSPPKIKSSLNFLVPS